MLRRVRAVGALEVHVGRVTPGLDLASLALVRVLDVVLQVLLPAERALAVLTLEIVLVSIVVWQLAALEWEELSGQRVV